MKHGVSLVAMIAALLTVSPAVNAAEHSLSVGYTRAKLDSLKFNGVNVKYRYEWGSALSVIGSFSYQTDKRGLNSDDPDGIYNGSARIKNGSLMLGPAWRFNDFFSLYAMAGVNKFTMNQHWQLDRKNSSGTLVTEQFGEDFHRLSPIVSVGTQFNPRSSVVIDLSYEMTKPRIYEGRSTFSFITLGLGVKF